MKEGQRCSLTCSGDHTRVGHFTCSWGKFVGASSCWEKFVAPNGERRRVEVVTKIASTLEVEIDVLVGTSAEMVSEFFKKSLVVALEVSTEQVTRLEVREIGQGNSGRRLRSVQTVRYEISYEIIAVSSRDADALLEMAKAMTTPSTTLSQVFWQALSAQFQKVHKVLLKLPVRKFLDEIAIVGQDTQDPAESPEWTSTTVAMLTCVIFLCVVCVVMGCLRTLVGMWKRVAES